jgi:TatD DNase family protein
MSHLKSTTLSWIDSHAHLDFDRFDDDRAEVIARAQERGVKKMISIGTHISSTLRAIKLAERYPQVIYATAGFHPLYMDDDHDHGWSQLEILIQHPSVVGVGETGLDYYYDKTPPAQQRQSFREHLKLSNRFQKPIVIHIRDAFDDAYRIIEEEGVTAGGVVHCFTGGVKECQRALELGLYISISGIATFKSAKALRQAVPLIPKDRLLLETDAPFLAPTPHRGNRNEPSYVVDTASCVAQLRETELAQLAHETYDNTLMLFNLDKMDFSL